jgi:hypothetical protein
MSLTIRALNETDYDDILVGWWKDWNWEAPSRDFLPDDGKCGVMIMDGDIPVCAGFMYITNSKASWIDWIISNKNYRVKPNRREALKLLIASLTVMAEDSGSKYGYALIKNKSLIEVYESFGYTKGDSYTSEMIKIF